MSGLVTGLQNRLRRFESARHLTSERYPLPQRISFFFIPNRYFSRSGFSSYLVWVGVKFSNAKEEELLINDASQIGSKKFDFSIE